MDYVIQEYRYSIEGSTREAALRRELNLPEQPFFRNYAEMEQFASEVQQTLVNLRIFEESEVTLEQHEENTSEYILHIAVVDGWIFFPLIVPIYNTNDDFSLRMKIKYSNVFGTLLNFYMDGDFDIGLDPTGETLGINYWELETGLGNIKAGVLDFDIIWTQSYERLIKKEGTEIIDFYTFNTTKFRMETTRPLHGHYYYTIAPAFELSYNYTDRTDDQSSDIDKLPLAYGIYQRFGNNQVDWIGNFRSGTAWEALLITKIIHPDEYRGEIGAQGSYYHIFSRRFSFATRGLALSGLGHEMLQLGKQVRGVADFNLSGQNALYWNNNLGIHLFHWDKIGDFQFLPLADFVLIQAKGREFDARKDFRTAVGFDGVYFPEKLKNVQIRATLGFDLFGPGPLSERYEILVSTSLFF